MNLTNAKLSPLYNINLIESNNAHYYQIGGGDDWYPGSTTVLKVLNKPALIPWAVNSVSSNIKTELLKNINGLTKETIEQIVTEGKNIYKKKASDAADIGTRVHKGIDDIIKGKEPTIDPDTKAGIEGFLKWKDQTHLDLQIGDTKLGSKLFGYGGSLDFIGFDGDEPIIFDIKTTKKRKDRDHGIYPEYGLQLASYAQAFKETYGLEVKRVYALWVNKQKPEFKAVKVSNLQVCFESFLACLRLYKTQKYELFEEE